MRNLSVFFIINLLLIFPLFHSCEEKDADDLISSIAIAGKVVDKETGKAIADCEVKLNSEQFVRTKSDGSFSITNGEGKGSYTLTFSANGYAPREITKNVTNQSKLDFGTIELEKGYVILKGIAIDKKTNDAIKNCRVEYEGLKFTFTNDDGEFSLKGIAPDSTGYTLKFIKDGYEELTETRNASQQTEIDFGYIQLNPRITLKGTILDVYTKQPLANCSVTLGEKQVVSTIDGQFFFYDLLSQSDFTLSFSVVGYSDKNETRQVQITGNIADFNTVYLDPLVNLSGTVLNENTNEPIVNCQVSIGESKATTGADGTYNLYNLPPQPTYTVKFSAFGYSNKEETKPVIITDAKANFGSTTLAPLVTLTGTVVADDSLNTPVLNCTVSVNGIETKTDIDGSYKIVGLEVASYYTVTFAKENYKTTEITKAINIVQAKANFGTVILSKGTQTITSLSDLTEHDNWDYINGKFQNSARDDDGYMKFEVAFTGTLSFIWAKQTNNTSANYLYYTINGSSILEKYTGTSHKNMSMQVTKGDIIKIGYYYYDYYSSPDYGNVWDIKVTAD